MIWGVPTRVRNHRLDTPALAFLHSYVSIRRAPPPFSGQRPHGRGARRAPRPRAPAMTPPLLLLSLRAGGPPAFLRCSVSPAFTPAPPLTPLGCVVRRAIPPLDQSAGHARSSAVAGRALCVGPLIPSGGVGYPWRRRWALSAPTKGQRPIRSGNRNAPKPENQMMYDMRAQWILRWGGAAWLGFPPCVTSTEGSIPRCSSPTDGPPPQGLLRPSAAHAAGPVAPRPRGAPAPTGRGRRCPNLPIAAGPGPGQAPARAHGGISPASSPHGYRAQA